MIQLKQAALKKDRKYVTTYILFAYLWSYIFWIISIVLSIRWNIPLLQNAPLLKALLNKELTAQGASLSLISFFAGYGPMLACFFILLLNKDNRKYIHGRFHLKIPFKYVSQVLLIFLVISLIPSIPFFNFKNVNESELIRNLFFMLLFFFYQLGTSGTEEIGWRGYLLPAMMKRRSLWNTSVIIGILWAFWHTPIVLYIFYTQGLTVPQMLSSFIGFAAGTIAMSALLSYYYIRTKNVFFSMIIHAVGNTFPMVFGLFTGESYMISAAVQVLLWIVIIYLSKKYKTTFDEIQPIVQ